MFQYVYTLVPLLLRALLFRYCIILNIHFVVVMTEKLTFTLTRTRKYMFSDNLIKPKYEFAADILDPPTLQVVHGSPAASVHSAVGEDTCLLRLYTGRSSWKNECASSDGGSYHFAPREFFHKSSSETQIEVTLKPGRYVMTMKKNGSILLLHRFDGSVKRPVLRFLSHIYVKWSDKRKCYKAATEDDVDFGDITAQRIKSLLNKQGK